MTTRVMVADDDELVRAGVRTILDGQSDIDVVADVPDGAAAVDAVAASRPDVVLMDIRMPGMDGIEATALLKKAHPAARVVIVSDHEQDDLRLAARQAGAEAYVPKTDLLVLRRLLDKP